MPSSDDQLSLWHFRCVEESVDTENRERAPEVLTGPNS